MVSHDTLLYVDVIYEDDYLVVVTIKKKNKPSNTPGLSPAPQPSKMRKKR